MKSFNTIPIPPSRPETMSAAKLNGVIPSAKAPADRKFDRSEAEEPGGVADGGDTGTWCLHWSSNHAEYIMIEIPTNVCR